MPPQENRRIFVAGASGAIGRPLCRLLVADGWQVTGTTRSKDKAAALAALGIEPVVVDVYDAAALRECVRKAQPQCVIHQLTDLPPALDPVQLAGALVRNARLRDIGTRNLVAAAIAAGAKRLIAQSICFAYAPGPMPYREDAPLNLDDPVRGVTARGVERLEEQVLAAPLTGVVLRYGKLYGPGTGFDRPARPGALHVDAAADAARRAITRARRGIYNIAEDDGLVDNSKAIAELDWKSDLRIAKPA